MNSLTYLLRIKDDVFFQTNGLASALLALVNAN